MMYCIKILILSILVTNSYFPECHHQENYLVAEQKVSTYIYSLLTKEGKHVNGTITAVDENQARTLIYSQYPGCTIYSIDKLRN